MAQQQWFYFFLSWATGRQPLPTRARFLRFSLWLGLGAGLVLGFPPLVRAGLASSTSSTGQLQVALDTVWVLVAGFLVFFMNAGFCMLETGFCRSKNAVNLLAKNLIVFGLSTLAFWILGFALMFGDGNGFVGFSGFL